MGVYSAENQPEGAPHVQSRPLRPLRKDHLDRLRQSRRRRDVQGRTPAAMHLRPRGTTRAAVPVESELVPEDLQAGIQRRAGRTDLEVTLDEHPVRSREPVMDVVRDLAPGVPAAHRDPLQRLPRAGRSWLRRSPASRRG